MAADTTPLEVFDFVDYFLVSFEVEFESHGLGGALFSAAHLAKLHGLQFVLLLLHDDSLERLVQLGIQPIHK